MREVSDAEWEAKKREWAAKRKPGRPRLSNEDTNQIALSFPVSWLMWFESEAKRLTLENYNKGIPKAISKSEVVRRMLKPLMDAKRASPVDTSAAEKALSPSDFD